MREDGGYCGGAAWCVGQSGPASAAAADREAAAAAVVGRPEGRRRSRLRPYKRHEILVADSFNRRFFPISKDQPRVSDVLESCGGALWVAGLEQSNTVW